MSPVARFYVARYGLLRWHVVVRGSDGVHRPQRTKFFRWISAARVCSDFIEQWNNAVDVQKYC